MIRIFKVVTLLKCTIPREQYSVEGREGWRAESDGNLNVSCSLRVMLAMMWSVKQRMKQDWICVCVCVCVCGARVYVCAEGNKRE